ncbi:branched-chain amino acid aminotransferase [Gorillibacterium massiliense]|uniref:branched-chain amino acid aminotransferase n=1 Tax=Gorillibacterium massiliense TaxID=1280390 RepID=UPI0004B6B022|nr:branched-chain amino acid aminotransferase [Gorillibacterium massiliense]
MAYTIPVERTKAAKSKPSEDQLVFGKYYTDHMFILDYDTENGWHDPRITPYQPLVLDPAAKVFHYGQSIFEGLKAYRTEDGRILMFRPDMNAKRLNQSNYRMCIPPIDEEMFHEALQALLQVDQDWIPSTEGTSLYIRPFVIATQPNLGVAPSTKYRFMIILSPVGSYYAEGIHPVKIFVESEYVRTVKGGTGMAKTAGNYAASLVAQQEANKVGYTQVLWLDALHGKYIEEVGSMNVFFKINGIVVTPALTGSILNGITRDSVIHLLQEWGVPVEERQVSIDELYKAHLDGTLEEAFGTGTAAVISPIGEMRWGDKVIPINNGETGEISSKVYDTITGIQYGTIEDPFNWVVELK